MFRTWWQSPCASERGFVGELFSFSLSPCYLFHSVSTSVVGGLIICEEYLLRELNLSENLWKRPEQSQKDPFRTGWKTAQHTLASIGAAPPCCFLENPRKKKDLIFLSSRVSVGALEVALRLHLSLGWLHLKRVLTLQDSDNCREWLLRFHSKEIIMLLDAIELTISRISSVSFE